MSSKSKKKTPQSAKASSQDVKIAEVVDDHAEEHHGLDEVIDVPTGVSPAKFVLMVVVVVVLIAIFAIDPGNMQRATQGGSGTFLSWTRPSTGLKVELTRGEFIQEKRKLDSLLGLFRSGNLKDEDVAKFILLGELSRDAGIAISDGELRERLTEFAGGGKAGLEAYMKRSPGRIHGFQETLRDKMRGDRYQQLIATLATHVDPADIEQSWREGHQEYAYDYVSIEVASLIEEALAELPDDEGLATWMAELSPGEQTKFYEPARITAELIGFLVDGDNSAEGLLARFPEEVEEPVLEDTTTGTEDSVGTEDSTGSEDNTITDDSAVTDDSAGTEDSVAAEFVETETVPVEDVGPSLTKLYYDSVFYSRFARPTPAEGEPILDFSNRFMQFDEVEEVAEREAPIYFALKRWLEDVEKREAAGTPVDLAAEASELGLSYMSADTAYSRTEWTKVEGWGGVTVGGLIDRLPVGGISSSLWVVRGALFVARQKERIESYLPELAEIRDDVVSAWADQRAGELAVERLEALRNSFAAVEEAVEETGDSDAEAGADGEAEAVAEDAGTEDEAVAGLASASEAEFAEAAAALGLEVGRRPYFEATTRFSQDPDKSKPGHVYILGKNDLQSLEAGELSSPDLNPTKTMAFLVRALGKRDPEAWRLSPREFDNAKRVAEWKAGTAFVQANFSSDALFKKYDLVLDDDAEQ